MAAPGDAVSETAFPSRRRTLISIALLLLYVVLAFLTRLGMWTAATTQIGGTGGDPQQSAWFLGWVPHALTHGESPFITDAMNAHAGVNLLWNTAEPAMSLLFWPLTTAANAVLTYNILITLALAFSAWFAYLAIRRYTRTTWTAALGGLIYGFSPLMSAQDPAHAQVVASAVTPPLLLLLLDEIVLRQRRGWVRSGFLLALLLVLQFFIFEEFFVTSILAAALMLVVLLIVCRARIRSMAPHALKALALAGVLTAAAIVYPVVVIQLHGPNAVNTNIHDPDIFVSDPLNFILPTPVQWLAPHFLDRITAHFSGNISEEDAYLGIPLLGTLLFVLVRFWNHLTVRVAGVFAVVIAILSLGPHLHFDGHKSSIPLPWLAVTHIPFLDDLLPSRLTVFMYLAAGVGLAVGLELILRLRRGRFVVPALVALVLLTLFPALPYSSEPDAAPAFSASELSLLSGATVAAIPFPDPTHMQAMDAQAAYGYSFNLVGGYFIGSPAADQAALKYASITLLAGGAAPILPPAVLQSTLQQLRDAGVGFVMLFPTPNQQAVAHFLGSALGAPLSSAGGVYLWRMPQR